MPDVGIITFKNRDKLVILDSTNLSHKFNIEQKYGYLYSGLNLKER